MIREACALVLLASLALATPPNHKIIGGHPAKQGQFGYQANLLDNGVSGCGASILNSRYLITAGHCLDFIKIDRAKIALGSLYRNGTGGDIYEIESYLIHPGFNLSTVSNDIGIVKLKKSIIDGPSITPLPLDTESIGAGHKVIESGWGYLNEWHHPAPLPENLQWIELTTFDHAVCKKLHQEWQSDIKVTDAMLCAYAGYALGGCGGDSGSPLVKDGKLVGICSWTNRCGKGYPDVFTRVSSYINWINENTKV